MIPLGSPGGAPVKAVVSPVPFPFEQNMGQADPSVDFLLRAGDVQASFGTGGIRLRLTDGQPEDAVENVIQAGRPCSPGRCGLADGEVNAPVSDASHVVALDFIGASDVRPEGGTPSDTLVSYFKGRPEEWLVGVPAFQQVTYRDVWPGIDVLYERAPGISGLKSAYLVAPGADPSTIRLQWRGVSGARLLEDGSIELTTPVGMLREASPVAWQDRSDGGRDAVPTRFVLLSSSDDIVEVRFALAVHDPTRQLTIDPLIAYAGYIGGSRDDRASGVAIDASGAAYVVGLTQSHDLPVVVGPNTTFNGNQTGFVAKVKPDGSGLVYGGFISGVATGVAVDASGAAYVVGGPTSDFPVLGIGTSFGGGGDAFVAKVKPDGTGLAYAGRIGGNQAESASGVALDGSGAAYVVGSTGSSPAQGFPAAGGPSTIFGGGQDSFIVKVNPAGSDLVYAGYIGGNQNDWANGVAVDASGAAYVVGMATSSPTEGFPAVVGPSLTSTSGGDAFVAKVKPDGSGFTFAGYIGHGIATGVALDSNGAAYVAGSTTDPAFPTIVGPRTTPPSGEDQDAFVAKVKPDGSGLAYSGFIGGSQEDRASGVAVDGNGAAYVVGWTMSRQAQGFPVIGGPSTTFGGGYDAFLARVNPDGSGLSSSGYIGGNGTEFSSGVAVGLNGDAYVVGYSLGGFPTSGGPNPTFNGVSDAFVAKVAESTLTVMPTPPVLPNFTINGGAISTTSVSVTLSLAATDDLSGAAAMSFSNDGITWGLWQPYATSATWTLAGGDGMKTVHARVRDGAGNVSAAVTASILLDTAVGPDWSVSINDGALYVNSIDVTLHIGAQPGTARMQVSNDGGFAGASWEPYASTKAWQITRVSGQVIPRTVYVRFGDASNTIVSGSRVSDDVVLDETPPTGSMTISTATSVQSPIRQLNLSASDDLSGVSAMRFSNRSDFAGAVWQAYAATATWNFTGGGTVYGQFRDRAGNLSPVYIQSLPGASPPGTSLSPACSPRPSVSVKVLPSNGTLVATLTVSGANNGLRAVRFDSFANAIVDVNDQVNQTAPFAVSIPPGQEPSSLQFTVRRQGAGATTVRLVVFDGCGEWSTFVGGGPSAF